MSTARQGTGGAKFIRCRRVPNGYQFFNGMTGYWLASVWVYDAADDLTNTRLRDAIQDAISQYGKALGL